MDLATLASRVRWALAITLILLIGAQFVRVDRTNPPTRPEASLLNQKTTSPAVRAILERSCRDCHSNDTRWPWYSRVAPISWMLRQHVKNGRDRMNYSEWTSYNSDDQDKLLNSMCTLTRKGRMPLLSYLWLHREAKLSADDIQALCAWSSKMRDTLQ